MKKIAIVPVAAAAAVLAAGALGASSEKFGLSATLVKGGEPGAIHAPANARGSFTGTLNTTSEKRTIRWKLTYSHLSGAAFAAHIHKGRPGVAGPVIVPLCGPCHSGQTGTATVTAAIAKAIRAGNTYVNVHTTKNKNGEIRGQLKASHS